MPPTPRRHLRTLVTLLVVAAALVGAHELRVRLGIEWSPESIQTTMERFGVWAPLGFLTLVLFRQLLALPSVLVLTAAGLLFGATLGTALGGLGIVLNACLLYTIARLMGRDWVLPRLQERYPDLEQRARHAGPVFIAIMTGHPTGVMTPFHLAAGVTGISAPAFVAAVGPTAPIRAACYAFLGAHLFEPGSKAFWLAVTILAVVALLPFAHPAFRRRFFARRVDDSAPAGRAIDGRA